MSRTNGKRPDGLTLFPWKSGKCMVWDYTCSFTVAASHIDTSSSGSGKIASIAEANKLRKYENVQESFEVIPVCVETLGP